MTMIPFAPLFPRRVWRAGLIALVLATMGAAHAAIPIQQWTHASGARVHLINSPSIPMLDVQIDFDGGRRRDPAQLAGLAGATAGLLSGGVADESATAHARDLLQSLGESNKRKGRAR